MYVAGLCRNHVGRAFVTLLFITRTFFPGTFSKPRIVEQKSDDACRKAVSYSENDSGSSVCVSSKRDDSAENNSIEGHKKKNDIVTEVLNTPETMDSLDVKAEGKNTTEQSAEDVTAADNTENMKVVFFKPHILRV